MKPVTKQEFDGFIRRVNALPDGFRMVGGYVQTNFLVNKREVARRSEDSMGVIYEIEDEDEP